jgi:hypothetical protein
MWKTFIHGQNQTKYKVGPSLSLDLTPFIYVEKKGKRFLKVETLAV